MSRCLLCLLATIGPWALAACAADNNIICGSGSRAEGISCVPEATAQGGASGQGQAGVSGQGQAGASTAGASQAGGGQGGGGQAGASPTAGTSGAGGAQAAGAGGQAGEGPAGAGGASTAGAGQGGQAQAGAGQAGEAQGGAGQGGAAGQAGGAGAGGAGAGGSGQDKDVVCGNAAEGATVTVTCPTATVVKTVTFASYGTPQGECGGFTKGDCHAETSQQVVEQACAGKESCSVQADNGTFGEPCDGQGKNLRVQVSCAAP